ncbi:MAG TPA: uracil-DNA glycosylase [Thermoanaerobaculia bacterium]|jgi:DNA polymerase
MTIVNDDLRRELALLRDFGYTHLDLTAVGPARLPIPQADAELPVLQELVPPPARDEIAAAASLDELRPIALPCTRCRLSASRTQVVFGTGNPNADLMFIGEAPGRDEDLQGEPFVGKAGQLLSDIIKAMKLTRDDVYIANVIKCRPPENRNPEPDELDACRPYIRKQVELIKPKVIVALGRFGLQSLMEKSYGITSVRGQWLEYNGIKLMPTYHPAYLLRTPAAKKDVWADMKKVMAELGIVF